MVDIGEILSHPRCFFFSASFCMNMIFKLGQGIGMQMGNLCMKMSFKLGWENEKWRHVVK